MIWRDILLGSRISDDAIVKGLAAAFSVQPDAIRISESIEELAGQSVFCLKTTLRNGDFVLLLTVYTSFEIDNSIDALKLIARILDSRILTSNDESSNPYSMLLIEPAGRHLVVDVNSDALDTRGEYELNTNT